MTNTNSVTQVVTQTEQSILMILNLLETKKINDKASAKSKLKALGLTDDEIEALQG